jgi:type III secretion protein U
MVAQEIWVNCKILLEFDLELHELYAPLKRMFFASFFLIFILGCMSLTGELVISRPLPSLKALRPRFERFLPNVWFGQFKSQLKANLASSSLALIFAIFVFIIAIFSAREYAGYNDYRDLIFKLDRWLFAAIFLSLIAGVAQFWLNRLARAKELLMSHDEQRREIKEDEGHPEIKGYLRALQNELARGSLVEKIKRSKVIFVERAK